MTVDKARCFGCGDMFEPWTNEWYCSDECPARWPDLFEHHDLNACEG
jgi:hypothetical protein